MSPSFRITVGSELDYEELVGDLYFEDMIVCVLSQEEGFENLQMKLYGNPEGGEWSFNLGEFEEALDALKKRMWDLRRIDSCKK